MIRPSKCGAAFPVVFHCVRLCREHIDEEWEDDDGYWIALKTGWKWAGDGVGSVHSIHESTRAGAYAERVMRCRCGDCGQ